MQQEALAPGAPYQVTPSPVTLPRHRPPQVTPSPSPSRYSFLGLLAAARPSILQARGVELQQKRYRRARVRISFDPDDTLICGPSVTTLLHMGYKREMTSAPSS